jgi:hypothetical protein
MSTKVFSNPDGVNSPEGGTAIGWTIQGVQLNPQTAPVRVFPFASNRTPATRPGWTVQSAVDGSDQSTVAHTGA